MNTDSVSFTETIDGREVEMILVETWDGLYAPIGVVRPEGEGPFPIVLLASDATVCMCRSPYSTCLASPPSWRRARSRRLSAATRTGA